MGKDVTSSTVAILILALVHITEQIRTDSRTDRRIHNLETELSKLRLLHNRGKDRLRELEAELAHYSNIFQGLDTLCSSLWEHKDRFRPFPTVQVPVKAIRPTVSGITVHSVTSLATPLGDTVVVQITVRYSTTETHEVIWAYTVYGHMVPVLEGDPFSSTRKEVDGERLTTQLYIEAHKLAKLELLYLKILSEFSEITVLFNTQSALTGSTAMLAPVNLWNEAPSPEVLVLEPDRNATVTTHIDTNKDMLTPLVNFISIVKDTKTGEETLLDIQLSDKRLWSKLKPTTRGFEWTVGLDSSLVGLGGMLSLRLVEQLPNGPVLQIHVGKTMYVIAKTLTQKAPFSARSVAILPLYRLSRQTVRTKTPISSIWCYAFGNPSPETKIFRISSKGEKVEMQGRVYKIGQYDSASVVLLRNKTGQIGGNYLCEASSGLWKVTEPIYVLDPDPH